MSDDLYWTISTGLAVLTILTRVGGAWACHSFRRLSPMLLLASAGFVGLCAASVIDLYGAFALSGDVELISHTYIVAGILGVLSNVLIVLGLGAAFVQIRRQLGLEPESPDVWE